MLKIGSEYLRTIGYNVIMNNEELILNYLCDKYGTDKGTNLPHDKNGLPMHNYTHVYAELFSGIKNKELIIFECGLGTNNINIESNMGVDGKPGASLRVWKEYFPHAHIYGADIDSDIIFQEDRISTGQMDQLSEKSINQFFNKFNNFIPDIVIDDGLHTADAAISLLKNVLPRLALDGLYIVEDMFLEDVDAINNFLSLFDNIQTKLYSDINGNTRVDNNLLVIKKIGDL